MGGGGGAAAEAEATRARGMRLLGSDCCTEIGFEKEHPPNGKLSDSDKV